MLDFDLTELLSSKLKEGQRETDGLLHPSGDLLGSLRHAQLKTVGAPTIESELLSDVRLNTGTMWHTYFEQVFRSKPAMLEVKLDKYLPTGWSGTADWILWSDEYKAFILGDLKTIKPEGMEWIQRDGMKQEHIWQVSSYWHALRHMGVPLVKGFVIYYLPMQPLFDKPNLKPMALEGEPLAEDVILPVMEDRWEATRRYHVALRRRMEGTQFPDGKFPIQWWLNDELAPVQERKQVLRWNKAMGVYDVKLEPHWSANYCPFPSELCDCREGKREKIGHYRTNNLDNETIEYAPRKGYEEITPIPLGKKEEKKLID